MAIKVLVADDHKLMVEGVRHALESAGDIEVVAEACDGTQVLPLIHQTSPDLVLLDLRMPGMSGLACLEAIRAKHPKVKVVVLSAFSDEEHIRSAIQRGATAYVVKSVSPLDLPSAIRQRNAGRGPKPSRLKSSTVAFTASEAFSNAARERTSA